jgi:signal transduction histidine kinase
LTGERQAVPQWSFLKFSEAEKPRAKRVARVLSMSALIAVFMFGLTPVASQFDSGLFGEFMHGFAELLPTLAQPQANSLAHGEALLSGSPAAALLSFAGLLHLLGLLLFSTGAVWAGYKFSGPVKVVFAVQLFVLSLVYQLLVWHFFRAPGHPVSIAAAILSALSVGPVLKSRDDERRQFEARQVELKMRNEELQESRLALVRQDESERRLLAADLHDQVLNDLRTIQKNFRQFADSEDHDPKERDRIDSLMKQTMSDIREIMDELCPVMLEEFGLSAAIEDRLDKASKLGGFSVRFSENVKGDQLDRLLPVQKLLLYRLVQESLTNICKHAGASLVRVAVEEEDSQLLLRVSDNGKGIDPATLSESSRGTLYMRLRAALIGAKVSWKQGPDGKGTTVEIRLHVQDNGS